MFYEYLSYINSTKTADLRLSSNESEGSRGGGGFILKVVRYPVCYFLLKHAPYIVQRAFSPFFNESTCAFYIEWE